MTVLSLPPARGRAADGAAARPTGSRCRTRWRRSGSLARRMQRYVNSRRWDPWDLQDRLRNPLPAAHRASAPQPVEPVVLVRPALEDGRGAARRLRLRHDDGAARWRGTGRRDRPWLASIPALKRDFGVTKRVRRAPDALPRRPRRRPAAAPGGRGHRDLVAVDGRAGARGSAPLRPARASGSIRSRSDRVLPIGESFDWNEYTHHGARPARPHPLPVAYEVDVDGVTVLFTGDQQEHLGIPGLRTEILNYQYRNRFRLGDYAASAALYRAGRARAAGQRALGSPLGGRGLPRCTSRTPREDLVEIHGTCCRWTSSISGRTASCCVSSRTVPRSIPARCSSSRPRCATRTPRRRTRCCGRSCPPAGSRSIPRSTSGSTRGRNAPSCCTSAWAEAPSIRSRVTVDTTIGSLLLGQHAEALVDVG